MRFFGLHSITKYQIDELKKVLKVPVSKKIINYNGNFIEQITMEKPIRIRNPDTNIYDLIKEYLEPWVSLTREKEEELIWKSIETGESQFYSFKKLPRRLKAIMRKYDGELYERQLNRYLTPLKPDYDNRIEKLEEMMPDYTDEEFIYYVACGNPLPSTLGRRARESARRSQKKFVELVKSNAHIFKHFMTFTFAPEKNKERHLELNEQRSNDEHDLKLKYVDDVTDFAKTKKAYTECMDQLRKNIKKRGMPFEYITVWEVMRNGAYHFHTLCSAIPEEEIYKVPNWLDTNFVKAEKNNGFGLKEWKYGKSDVQEIKDPGRVRTYVSKYIMKSFLNVTEDTYLDYLNKRKYFPSKGLISATSVYVDDLKEPDLEEYDKTYEKEYKNIYNDGMIKKVQYTKIV